jgi:hypothetical protein
VKKLERLDRAVSPGDIADVVHRDGVCLVEDLVEPSVLDQIASDMRPYIESTPTCNVELGGVRTRRTGGLASRSSAAREIIMHPRVIEAGRLIMAEAPSIQISNTEIISIGPGEEAQALHRDQDIWDYPFPPGCEITFSVMWPITDFTNKNGATRLVVGSHRSGRRDVIKEDEIQQAAMRKGSVLIWSGSLYHGGGTNSSDAVRQGVMLAYSVGWLRQEENQYLVVPKDIAAGLDHEFLKMLGYARGGQALGNAIDRSDPLGVFVPGLSRPGQIDPDLLEGYPLARAEQ